MKIFEFLDIKFQQASLKAGEAQGMDYSLMTAGRIQALHSSIHALRTLAKWLQIPVIFAEYALVKAKIMTPPVSPLKKPDLTMMEGGGSEAAESNLGAKA